MLSKKELEFMESGELVSQEEKAKSRELFVSEIPFPVEKELEREERSKKKFRIRSKRFFLTYPSLPEIDKLDVLFLESLRESFDIKSDSSWKYLLSVERHSDGKPHVHVYLEFPTVQGVYSRDKLTVKLSLDGKEIECEGKYEAVKNHHHVIQYVLKSVPAYDDVLTNMVLPILSGVYYSDPASHLHAAVVELGFERASKILIEQYRELVIKKGNALLDNMETVAKHFIAEENKKSILVRSMDEFENVPSSIFEWMYLDRKERRTLVLSGPPGTGKTEIAKSMMHEMGIRYIIIRDINVLRGLILSVTDGLIFDDFPLTERTREEMIHLLDSENSSTVRVLYGTIEIPARTPKIFTTNRIRQFDLHDSAISRRVTSIEIPKKLWSVKEVTKTITVTETTTFGSTATVGANATQGATLSNTGINETNQEPGQVIDAVIVTPKRGRGRPKGSKNKPKNN